MKPRHPSQKNQAFTLNEVIVVLAILVLLLFMVDWGATPRAKERAKRINCVSNLKQVDTSFRIWKQDNNNQYPMSVSVTNGGGMELIAMGNVSGCLQVMSNELSTPIILICPADMEHIPATNFQSDFNNSHINYFVNADATATGTYPGEVMLGDDNLATNGIPVKPGLLEFSTNTLISWTAARHRSAGNIALVDGSVAEISSSGLQQSAYLTNRLAIP